MTESKVTNKAKKDKSKKQKEDLKKPPTARVRGEAKFPFLKLPAEIRNMIYREVLVDEDYATRFHANISKRDGRSIVSRHYRARPGPPDRDDLPGQTKGSVSKASHSYKPFPFISQRGSEFSVHVFQVCQQLNAEAAPIFYSNNLFNFEGVPDLYAFLMHFQHRLPLVTKIGLSCLSSNYKTYRGAAHIWKMPLHAVFPLLVHAGNLEALYMHVPVWQSFGGRAHIAAMTFFRQGHAWLHALALRNKMKKKSMLEVLDVIKLPEAISGASEYGKWQVETAGHVAFRNELAGRLAVGK
jgi:hypothetical protein